MVETYDFYKVGEIYPQFKNLSEGFSATFTKYGINVLITVKAPTPNEIDAIQNGKVTIKGTFFDRCIPYLMFNFEGLGVFDTPVTIDEETKSSLINASEGCGYNMNIFLADVETGELKAGRFMGTLETKFSSWLFNAITSAKPLPEDDYQKKLRTIQQFTGQYLYDHADIENVRPSSN